MDDGCIASYVFFNLQFYFVKEGGEIRMDHRKRRQWLKQNKTNPFRIIILSFWLEAKVKPWGEAAKTPTPPPTTVEHIISTKKTAYFLWLQT